MGPTSCHHNRLLKCIWRVASNVSLNFYLSLSCTIISYLSYFLYGKGGEGLHQTFQSTSTSVFPVPLSLIFLIFCMEKGHCLVSWSGPSLFKEKTTLSTSDWEKSLSRGWHTIVSLAFFNPLDTVSDLSYRYHCPSFGQPTTSCQPRANSMTCSQVKWETQRGKRHWDEVIVDRI